MKNMTIVLATTAGLLAGLACGGSKTAPAEPSTAPVAGDHESSAEHKKGADHGAEAPVPGASSMPSAMPGMKH